MFQRGEVMEAIRKSILPSLKPVARVRGSLNNQAFKGRCRIPEQAVLS